MIRFALVLSLLAGTAHAQSVKLRASEIDVLLSGNTAMWQSGDVSYRQYFDPDGTTDFAPNGTPLVQGEWRVDAVADEIQILWPSGEDWEGLFVMEYAGVWYWVSKTTPPTPFAVLDGEHLATE